MKACPGQSGTGLVLYDAWAVPGVITDMCCLLKFTVHQTHQSPPATYRPLLANPVRSLDAFVMFGAVTFADCC